MSILGVEEEIPQEEGRKLVTLQRVLDVFPIEGADNIEGIKVLGWYLVAKKGEFIAGDTCVFFEIDSILPELPVFEFMRSRKFRVKTAKFKSQVSQGLALSLQEVLPLFGQKTPVGHSITRGSEYFPFDKTKKVIILEEGVDLTDLIGVKKYDPDGESLAPRAKREKGVHYTAKTKLGRLRQKYTYKIKLAFYKSRLAKFLGVRNPYEVLVFPGFIPKTDETRVQNLATFLAERKGALCYVTEKCEGQSLTVFRNRKQSGICSRNLDVTHDANCNWVKMATKYDLLAVLEKEQRENGRNLAIQAEIIGPSVQGNIYDLKELEIRVFYVYDIDKKRKLSYCDFRDFVNEYNLPMVPVLDELFQLPDSVDTLVDYSIGKSVINKQRDREGIVIAARHDEYAGDYFSFKAINPVYLLKQKD